MVGDMKFLKCLLWLILLGVVIGIPLSKFGMAELRTSSAKHLMYSMYSACHAFATKGDRAFPDGTTANEALRTLFKADLVDDENLFFLMDRSRRHPDGKIGDHANGFKEALAPDECCYYLVRISTLDSNPARPLLFTRLGSSNGRVHLISVSVAGHVTSELLTDTWLPGQQPDVLSKEFAAAKLGVDVNEILLPEGQVPGRWEIPLSYVPIYHDWRWVGSLIGCLVLIVWPKKPARISVSPADV